MCLAIPARIEQILDDGNGIVDFGGVRRPVSLALVDDVAVGDYVIVHVGFALQKLILITCGVLASIARSMYRNVLPYGC